jgi:hypothetical protein
VVVAVTVLATLSIARDAAEQAQKFARAAHDETNAERRAQMIRNARAHARVAVEAAQRATDLLETMT